MIVDVIKFKDIDNLDMLKIAANVVRHVEDSKISFIFSDNFKVEDIPDDVIINMLDNIDNSYKWLRDYSMDHFIL